MRKLIVIAVLAYLGYSYYNGSLELPLIGKRDTTPMISNDNPEGQITITGRNQRITPPSSSSVPAQRSSPYTCDGRQYCSQMRSFDEAQFFLRNCPNTKMDGDKDGVPCESQFGH